MKIWLAALTMMAAASAAADEAFQGVYVGISRGDLTFDVGDDDSGGSQLSGLIGATGVSGRYLYGAEVAYGRSDISDSPLIEREATLGISGLAGIVLSPPRRRLRAARLHAAAADAGGQR